MTGDERANNAAAYALGALEAGEATEYERHLRTCVVCRDEVAKLQRVADALPLTALQYRAPADLRRRVVGTVRAESRRRPRIVLKRGPALAGAVAVALAAVVVVTAIIASNRATGPRLLNATVRGSSATAELRIDGGRAELIVHRLPAPAAGRIYEVWLK
jgi:anti-sigma factor RsiW